MGGVPLSSIRGSTRSFVSCRRQWPVTADYCSTRSRQRLANPRDSGGPPPIAVPGSRYSSPVVCVCVCVCVEGRGWAKSPKGDDGPLNVAVASTPQAMMPWLLNQIKKKRRVMPSSPPSPSPARTVYPRPRTPATSRFASHARDCRTSSPCPRWTRPRPRAWTAPSP